MTRVLVCGGRYYDDRAHIFQTLTRIHHERGPITCVIHGDQHGADTVAKIWAETMIFSGWLMTIEAFPADWRKYGPFGGGIRNRAMLDKGKPDLVVAFPGGPGTANMIQQATLRGIEIIQIEARAR